MDEIEANIKRNNKFIKEFKSWLKAKNLGEKTIHKHTENIDLFLNSYIVYYEDYRTEEAIGSVPSYLGM